jgi:methylated-DNA-[protein]-cysteine S-methyltransferase
LESKQTAYYKTPIGIAKIEGDKNGIQSITVLNEVIEIAVEIPSILKD